MRKHFRSSLNELGVKYGCLIDLRRLVAQRNAFRPRQQIKRDTDVLQNENASSPIKPHGQKAGNELPPRTPVRRRAFATLRPSALNIRSPKSPALKKSITLPEKLTPTKFAPVAESTQLTPIKQVHIKRPGGTTVTKRFLHVVVQFFL